MGAAFQHQVAGYSEFQSKEAVDLVMDFTDPIILGVSLFHFHRLSHEDKG